MKIQRITITTLPWFWITSDLDENTLKVFVKNFDYQYGRYGYIHKSVLEKKKVINDFLISIEEYNAKIVYNNSLDRELKIRERNGIWLQKRLAENNITVPYNTISRWINNRYKPNESVKKMVEQILCFDWK